MIFYILFILFCLGIAVLGYFNSKHTDKIGFFLFLLIVLISGFRKNVGIDYMGYVSWYQNKTRDDDFEFGYVLIMDVFRKLNLDYSTLFFTFSFFTCLFVYLGLKKYTTNTNVALLFFIIIPSLYLASFTLIRQSFSVAISFYAFNFLLNKKYLIYVVLMFIGISIHRTCFVPFFLFYMVYHYADKIKFEFLGICMILSFILAKLQFISIFGKLFENMRYSYYFSDQQMPVDILKIIVLNLVAFFILFYYKKHGFSHPYQKYFLILHCCSIIILNLLSEHSDLTRIYVYFRIFEIVIISDLLIEEVKKRRYFLFFFFVLLNIGTFLFALKKIPGYLPYKNFLIDRQL
ncbi:hypothetical protein FFWV33_07760 [Flavobacterium faecale]|uniref:EpsG family protein n=1 Tax=Flavobacterium faecale TaxID=1355330 RepID=A0A2S1LCG8_9FLAO|nr:EpsG family protein [Flavobacterium faecale]AWG21434.1 hypothetical protein FFWV33_07760 [Flavobacterium faecale]